MSKRKLKKKQKKLEKRRRKEEKRRRRQRRGNQFDFTEIYRQLRTNLEFSNFQNDAKVINITSTNAGEGKSIVASNLAIICTDNYKKVLLIDCDLRRPVQHRRFRISNKVGLSNLMKNKELMIDLNDDYYFKKFRSSINNENYLYVLPSGSKVPNPQELLSSERFKELIHMARYGFDYIIIDCPPVGVVSDAVPVSNVCDGTIFVCSAQDTNKADARDALKQLERNGAHVIGCVLTKVDEVHHSKYGYYYYSE